MANQEPAPASYLTREQTEMIVADAMIACAKAWLPENPAHIGEAAAWLDCQARMRVDPAVVESERNIVGRLRRNSPTH